MSTHSVKYGLTYSGRQAKQAKDSKKPIIYHITAHSWHGACGVEAFAKLDKKPTGKRYQLCLRCADSVKKV